MICEHTQRKKWSVFSDQLSVGREKLTWNVGAAAFSEGNTDDGLLQCLDPCLCAIEEGFLTSRTPFGMTGYFNGGGEIGRGNLNQTQIFPCRVMFFDDFHFLDSAPSLNHLLPRDRRPNTRVGLEPHQFRHVVFPSEPRNELRLVLHHSARQIVCHSHRARQNRRPRCTPRMYPIVPYTLRSFSARKDERPSPSRVYTYALPG
jgi:hypothetical protein